MALSDRLVFVSYASADVTKALTDSISLLSDKVGTTITEGGDYDEAIVLVALRMLEYSMKVSQAQADQSVSISHEFIDQAVLDMISIADESVLFSTSNETAPTDSW